MASSPERRTARARWATVAPSAQWCVLDWNTPSIEFYRAAGARPQEGWSVFRLTDDALAQFAQERTS